MAVGTVKSRLHRARRRLTSSTELRLPRHSVPGIPSTRKRSHDESQSGHSCGSFRS
ncbi:hypothetical protein OOK21_34395 [Streptomyces sp. NBC_00338]|nr:hypothetical protein [Streptomyces sp. NBC_00338]